MRASTMVVPCWWRTPRTSMVTLSPVISRSIQRRIAGRPRNSLLMSLTRASSANTADRASVSNALQARTYSATGAGRAAVRFESVIGPACGLPQGEGQAPSARLGLTQGEGAQYCHARRPDHRRIRAADPAQHPDTPSVPRGRAARTATVDPGSGYRYYTTEQIPAAQIIQRLRELGMPLRQVGEMLATPDPDSRAALVAAHLGRLESELERTRTAVRARVPVSARVISSTAG